MRLRLVVPADVETPTGGNVYDRALADALRRDGHQVEMLPATPDRLASLLDRSDPTPTLVDGLLACPAPDVVAESHVGVLVHMPLAWDPELSPERAVEVDAWERNALAQASVVVTTSHWSAGYLRQRHGLSDVVVAPPGVERAAVVHGSDPPLMVQVAALLPNKDQLAVVEALSRLVDLPWRARLVGSVERHPAYADRVRAAVEGAGLVHRIEIVGVRRPAAAWDGADLALLPSRVEAFGMVVTEALARGLPVLVSDGGAAEALGVTRDGRRPGLVVPPGEVSALTAALRRWLTDPALRSELRARALVRRDGLDGWDVTARRVLAAFRRG